MKKYSTELKEKVVELNLREGRSMSSLEKEYNLSKGCVSNWVKSYSKECQHNSGKQEEKEYYAQMLALKKEVDELRKENLFLKKAAAFFAKEIYDFISNNKTLFGLRWLLKRLNINTNSYYFFIKNKPKRAIKQSYKQTILSTISKIYHKNNGTPGYRMMTNELRKEKIILSPNTVYLYMKRLDIHSVTRRKYHYARGEAHEVFENLLEHNFTASKPNEKWCTYFTYLYLENGEKYYNCAIIDLYDRSIVASICADKIDAKLAITTLQKALKQERFPKNVILHSDQGSQYTSKIFTEFCRQHGVMQSMSKAGCPYDNAPMERFYNTLKVEFYHLFKFRSQAVLYRLIQEFIYVRYNHARPHSFNDGLSPIQKRFSIVKSA